ncbi:structural maintenance of chromosomes protein 2 [Clarias magur]|uniref:Structural maintenance of chromosomes protein 2 n=1 Tax=Clarias magur TaxID=1594786 RepID=A0A8J4TQ43_CLAMG|nr:structural maintenance of chromosomes protein 2 [Clarias magur]
MFTNANVLYKTKFVDGISTVTRTAQTHEGKVLAQRSHDKAKTKDKRQQFLELCF